MTLILATNQIYSPSSFHLIFDMST